jgi:hypothetical protein
MCARLVILLCGLMACSAGPAQVEINVGVPGSSAGPASGNKKIRLAPTKDEVLEKRRNAPKPYESAGVQSQDAAQVRTPAQPALLGSALMLNDGKRWTVLPRRAVLRFSDEVKPYIKEGQAGDLVTWQQFQAANSAWVRAVPVNDGLISGKVPVSEEMRKQWQESKVLLVSTYNNNPISLPLAPDPKNAQTTPNQSKP